MPYDRLSDLETDLYAIGKARNSDINITDHAINEVYLTDTNITMPWIYQILRKNKDQPQWSTAYRHWVELRKLFGKKEEYSASVGEAEELAPFLEEKQLLNPDLEKQNKIKYHTQQTALAIQSIEVSAINSFNVLLLVCTVIGLNKRMNDLDQGKLENFGYNWLMLQAKKLTNVGVSRAIAAQTKQTRVECFQPIYKAITLLVNNYLIIREKIQEKNIAKQINPIATQHQEEEKSDPRSITSFNAEKYDFKIAIKKSQQYDLEIKLAEERLLLSKIKLSEIEVDIFCLKALNNKIESALEENQVIEFHSEIADDLQLTEDEKNAWENYYYIQNSNYFNQVLTIATMKFIGNYQEPNEIMKPIIDRIHTRILQDKSLITSYAQDKENILKIKQKKQNLDHEIKLIAEKEKIKMLDNTLFLNNSTLEQKHHTAERDDKDKPSTLERTNHLVNRNMALAHIAFLEHNERNLNPVRIPWWQTAALYFAGTSLGAVIGWAIGLAVGIIIGITLGGIGTIAAIPLCCTLGVIIGGILGGDLTEDHETTSQPIRDEPPENIISVDGPFQRSDISIQKELGRNPNNLSVQSPESLSKPVFHQIKSPQDYKNSKELGRNPNNLSVQSPESLSKPVFHQIKSPQDYKNSIASNLPISTQKRSSYSH